MFVRGKNNFEGICWQHFYLFLLYFSALCGYKIDAPICFNIFPFIGPRPLFGGFDPGGGASAASRAN